MEENRVCDGGEYAKLTWPNFTRRSKKTYSKRIPMMYTCYIENFFEDVDDHDMTPVTEKNQLGPV
jgi:hypothetical protein